MKLTKQKLYKLIQEQYDLSAEQREKLLMMLTTDVESAIQALEIIDALDLGRNKLGLLGDAMSIANKAGYKKREVHAFLLKVTEELFMANLPDNLKEATGEQKRQQKRDAYASKEKDRRKFKARIKRQNRTEPVEPSITGDPIDFDPIKDLGKAMKKRYKDLEVRANGEEIED